MGNTSKSNTLSRQFEALFHYATIGILITDSSGKIVNANGVVSEEFGYAKDELIGAPIEILIPDKYSAVHVHHRDSFYKHPKNRTMGSGRDLFAKRKDGTQFPVEISLSHYSVEGEIFVIAFIINISVRKASEQLMITQQQELEGQKHEIQVLNKELERKVEDRTKMLREALRELELSKEELSELLEREKELGDLKSRFVTTASHEFRTPLSTILSSVSLIAKYTQSSEQDKRDKHIKRIRDAVENMKNILEDFLSLGKLEEGLIKEEHAEFTAEEFVDIVLSVSEDMQQICKQGQNIVVKNAIGENVTLDPKLFKNVLTNLLSNAIKFSPEDSDISVRLHLDKNELVCSVKDAGIGISEEDQTHLFERFFRAKNATNIHGTGLGLHIVNKYLQLMNGRIELKSQLHHGTEFIFYIPQINEH